MEDLELQEGSIDVVLSLDEEANGPRLRVENRATGEVNHLGPLQIECLTRVPDGQLKEYVDD